MFYNLAAISAATSSIHARSFARTLMSTTYIYTHTHIQTHAHTYYMHIGNGKSVHWQEYVKKTYYIYIFYFLLFFLLGNNSARSHCNSEWGCRYTVGVHCTPASTSTISGLIGKANHSVPVVPDVRYC